MYVACGAREIFWRGTVALSLRAVRQNRSIWHDAAVKVNGGAAARRRLKSNHKH